MTFYHTLQQNPSLRIKLKTLSNFKTDADQKPKWKIFQIQRLNIALPLKEHKQHEQNPDYYDIIHDSYGV